MEMCKYLTIKQEVGCVPEYICSCPHCDRYGCTTSYRTDGLCGDCTCKCVTNSIIPPSVKDSLNKAITEDLKKSFERGIVPYNEYFNKQMDKDIFNAIYGIETFNRKERTDKMNEKMGDMYNPYGELYIDGCKLNGLYEAPIVKAEPKGHFNIKEVIYHDPATIVYWADGTKTVVKCCSDDTYSKESGLAMCCLKRLMGNDNSFHSLFKEWC